MLFERMSWEENLALGGFAGKNEKLDLRAIADRARQLAQRLGFALPPSGATVEERSVSERVRLEILRALSFDPQVLILDEPTGVLAPDELAAFLETLRRLRAEGRLVVLVTHKLAEALAVADRVTVLRHGRTVGEKIAAETSEAELAQMMIGELPQSGQRPLDSRPAGNMRTHLRQGGVGKRRPPRTRRSFVRARGGRDGGYRRRRRQRPGRTGRDSRGRAATRQRQHPLRRRRASREIAVIPQNRDLDGLVLEMPLWENLLLAGANCAGASPDAADGFNANELIPFAMNCWKSSAFARPGVEAGAAALSGGNRQRLAVARALATSPRVIVAHDICRGLDLRATADVHRMLREYCASGGAVLLISCDLEELLALCGRLAVMSRGRLTEISAADRDPVRIGLLMSGAAR